MECKCCKNKMNTSYNIGGRETIDWCSVCGAICKFSHNKSTRKTWTSWRLPVDAKIKYDIKKENL